MDKRPTDGPRFRFSADRHSAKRRVIYVESNRPGTGNCTICQLDELAQEEQSQEGSTVDDNDKNNGN